MPPKQHLSQATINGYERLYKINLVNSLSGFKSANLIGTKSADGQENLAVFSSVFHLGSSPALLGFILRPTTVARHTYDNILATGHYTINHIAESFAHAAHQTSAKYPHQISEFEATGLEPVYYDGNTAPFVKESPVQISMRFKQEIPIEANGTLLIIGEILDVYFEQDMLLQDGFLDLAKGKVVSINGLDAYCSVKPFKRFEYARPSVVLKEYSFKG